MNDTKIENFEAIMCLIMISIANIVLISSKILIKDSSSASLITVGFISIIVTFFVLIICQISKNFIGKSLIDISCFLGGNKLKLIIGISYSLYFLFITGLFLKRMGDALQTIYFPLTNTLFIITLFCIACGIISMLPNNSLFKSMVLLVPFLYWAVVLVFIGNGKNFHFSNVYPILGNGFKSTFLLGFTNIFSFSGLNYLFLLPPKLKHPEKITHIGILFTISMGIYLLICIASILFMFGDTLNNSDLPPLYISVRYIEFGTFFQRLDAAFIFICVLGFICSLNINLYFILDLLKNIFNLSDSKPLTFPCLSFALGMALLVRKNTTLEWIENSFSKLLFIVFALIIPFTILILSVLKKKIK